MKLLYFFAICFCVQFAFANVQTLQVSSASPFLTLEFWDYEAEDGDWVRIVVDGNPYREFELKNFHKSVTIPILFSEKKEIFVNVIGVKSGSGPVTYAVQATGLGSSLSVYKNYADVGAGNSYRIVKTTDDLFSKGANFIGLMPDEDFESSDDLVKKEKIANLLNDKLIRLPDSLNIPQIKSNMIRIDPAFLDQINEDAMMAYDVDANQFIFRSDISDPSIFSRISDGFLSFCSIFDSSITSGLDDQDSDVVHELSHYVQDVLNTRNSEKYLRMNSQDTDSLIVAEGFAVIMSVRYGAGKGSVLVNHKGKKLFDGDGITYIQAAENYIKRIGRKEYINANEVGNILKALQNVEKEGTGSWRPANQVYEELQKISGFSLLYGLEK